MTHEEIEAFLSEPRLCHFATIDSEGNPRVRPLWYLWRDDGFLLTTLLERRHTGRDLASNPRVAISVASETRPYRAVVAHGRPEILPKELSVLLDIAGRYGQERGRLFAAEAMEQPDRVLLRLVPDELVSWDYGSSA